MEGFKPSIYFVYPLPPILQLHLSTIANRNIHNLLPLLFIIFSRSSVKSEGWTQQPHFYDEADQ